MQTTTREPSLPGSYVVRMMRANGHTIRSLAAAMNVPMTRVRQVRAAGVRGSAFVQDWNEALHAPSQA